MGSLTPEKKVRFGGRTPSKNMQIAGNRQTVSFMLPPGEYK